MTSGKCFVCQVQGSRIEGLTSGHFEGLEMCHTHLLDAREGKLAPEMLRQTHLAVKPINAASASVGEQPKPRAKKMSIRPRTLEVIARLRRGEGTIQIAEAMGISTSSVRQTKHYYLWAERLPASPGRPLCERTQQITERLKGGMKICDIAKELKVTHSYVSHLKRKYLGDGATQ